MILRGGKRSGPNYGASHVAEVSALLAKHGLCDRVMVDCSHGNSEKDHRRQPLVAADICEQIRAGSRRIFGVMLESHLVEGRQDYVPGHAATYGQSITDACISLEQTEVVLEQLAQAQRMNASATMPLNRRPARPGFERRRLMNSRRGRVRANLSAEPGVASPTEGSTSGRRRLSSDT